MKWAQAVGQRCAEVWRGGGQLVFGCENVGGVSAEGAKPEEVVRRTIRDGEVRGVSTAGGANPLEGRSGIGKAGRLV